MHLDICFGILVNFGQITFVSSWVVALDIDKCMLTFVFGLVFDFHQNAFVSSRVVALDGTKRMVISVLGQCSILHKVHLPRLGWSPLIEISAC